MKFQTWGGSTKLIIWVKIMVGGTKKSWEVTSVFSK